MGVLWENERGNPRNGVLHRVREGVYSGISSVRMRERIPEVEVAMRFRVAVTCGWEVATKTKNHQEAQKEVLAAEKRARATQESILERRG